MTNIYLFTYLFVYLFIYSSIGFQIYSFQKVLQMSPVSTADESKVMIIWTCYVLSHFVSLSWQK